MKANGSLSYEWLYIVILFESKPKEAVLGEFNIQSEAGEHVGHLLGYSQKDTEVTLCFEGDWTNPEGLSLCGLNQVQGIANISNKALL